MIPAIITGWTRVIGRAAQPSGVVRFGDDARGIVRAAVEVDPPDRDRSGERDDEGGNGRGSVAAVLSERRARYHDGLAERDKHEGLASLGEVTALDRPVLRHRAAESGRVEADPAAHEVHRDRGQPQHLAPPPVGEPAGHASAPLTTHHARIRWKLR